MTIAIAEMYVQGVSTRKVTKIVEELCGLEVTSTQVSRAAAELDKQLDAWRNRALGEVIYLILDARYEKVRIDGTVVPCALLTAIVVGPDGKRSTLGCSVALSEAEVHWRQFLESLRGRGMLGVALIVSDDHSSLRAAREAVLPGVPWQRCQCHVMQNAMAHVTKMAMKAEVAADLRRVFDADESAEAQRRRQDVVARYRKVAPQLADWIEANLPKAFTVPRVPSGNRDASARPTASSDLTRKSSDVPASRRSSRTRPCSSASPPQSCPRSAMTRKRNVPT